VKQKLKTVGKQKTPKSRRNDKEKAVNTNRKTENKMPL
jgi:hypothetical protein